MHTPSKKKWKLNENENQKISISIQTRGQKMKRCILWVIWANLVVRMRAFIMRACLFGCFFSSWFSVSHIAHLLRRKMDNLFSSAENVPCYYILIIEMQMAVRFDRLDWSRQASAILSKIRMKLECHTKHMIKCTFIGFRDSGNSIN